MRYQKALSEKLLRYFRSAEEDLPSFVRFAAATGTDLATLQKWRREHPEFAAAWQACEDILCDRIVDGAMHKRFDVSFSKFFLTARFGWSEKAEAESDRDFALRIRVLEDGGGG